MKHNAAFAGTFYPEDPKELASTIDTMISESSVSDKLDKTSPVDKTGLKALIVPHAGYVYSGPAAAYAYSLLQKCQFTKAIVIGPSHRHPFTGIAFANYSEWETTMGIMPVSDSSSIERESDFFELNNKVLSSEHSIEVQLPFLQKVKSIESWLPLVTGSIQNFKEIAAVINRNLDNETILIISSDLSHFLSYEDCCAVDQETIQKILTLYPLSSGEQACGHAPIEILRELALLNGWKANLLQYQNSGDTAGDKDRVVGYASVSFTKENIL